MDSHERKPVSMRVDPETVAFYLEVPRDHVVLLQAYFELYDGIGTIRTLQDPPTVVCVLTTPDQEDDCIRVLQAIRDEVRWSIRDDISTYSPL